MGPIDLMSVIQSLVLAVVALILGLFVIRPILMSQARQARLTAETAPLALPATASVALAGEGLAASTLGGAPMRDVRTGEIEDGPDFAFDGRSPDELPMDPVARLRRLIEERQSESVEILRGWMEQDEERA